MTINDPNHPLSPIHLKKALKDHQDYYEKSSMTPSKASTKYFTPNRRQVPKESKVLKRLEAQMTSLQDSLLHPGGSPHKRTPKIKVKQIDQTPKEKDNNQVKEEEAEHQETQDDGRDSALDRDSKERVEQLKEKFKKAVDKVIDESPSKPPDEVILDTKPTEEL